MRVLALALFTLTACGGGSPSTPPKCARSRSLADDLTAKTTHVGPLWTLRFFHAADVTALAVESVASIDGATQQSFGPGPDATVGFEPHDATATVVMTFNTTCEGGPAHVLRADLVPTGVKADGTVANYAVELSDAP